MRSHAAIVAALFSLLCSPAGAEMNGTLRIGVMNDMSSVYSDFQGPGSVVAAQLAAEDFAKQSKRKVEVLSADHQNKPDVGAQIARRWFDVDGVDMIIDVPNSAVALAVADLARGVLQRGGRTWFFITADYAFGDDLQKHASDEVIAKEGKVLGSVRHPLGVSDFSSFLLQAQASGAQVIGLANAGGDTVNAIKQAAEFNLGEKQKIVALIFDLQSVPALGLKTAQGIVALNAFYWDLNDKTRAWSARYQERYVKKEMPNHMQAGVYSATMDYLRAVDKVGSPADGRAVVTAMKATPIDDPLFGKVTIREDGRALHDMYLVQVKSPEESKSTWDVFKVTATIDADHAFRPLNEGGCPLVAK